MRTYIRTLVDINSRPDLSELKPIEGLIVSIRYAYNQLDWVKQRNRKKETEILRKELDAINKLKKVLIYKIGKYLKPDSKVQSITIYVDRSSEPIIERVINSADFYAFQVEAIPENPDYLVSFPDLPIKLKVRRRE